jgi:hypothetical protein
MARGFATVFPLGLPLSLVGGLAFLSACGRPVGPAACGDPRDCAAGESCSAGACVVGGGGGPCTTDLDCDPSQNQICASGTCIVGDGNPQPDGEGGACSATADCPISQFCNTATGVCSALLDGWCRQDSQCGAEAALCSNISQGGSDYPGRCVACLEDSDCDGGTCISPGVCQRDSGCGANATAVAGGGCRCNPGFVDDGTGDCVADVAAEGEGEDEEPVPTEGEGEDEDPIPTEGEGEADPVGESCEISDECFERHDINWTCEDSQCICDEPWLDFICDGAYDLDACDCTAGGGGTGGGASTANDPCLDDTDCGALSCIFGAEDVGACKELCNTDGDCSGGLECMDGVLSGDQSGICADVRNPCQTCDASIYSGDIATDSICDGGTLGILDCFAGRCEQVCDWEGNTGAEEDCDAGFCGDLEFRSEVGGDVAVCE